MLHYNSPARCSVHDESAGFAVGNAASWIACTHFSISRRMYDHVASRYYPTDLRLGGYQMSDVEHSWTSTYVGIEERMAALVRARVAEIYAGSVNFRGGPAWESLPAVVRDALVDCYLAGKGDR